MSTTEPATQELIDRYNKAVSARRRGKWLNICIAVFVAITLSAFVVSFFVTQAVSEATSANTAALSSLRQDLKTVCRQADANKLPTPEQDKCFRAEANLPPQSAPSTQATPSQPEVSNDQLLTLIRGVLATHPPQDGHTPTAEELLALIRPLIPAPVAGKDGTPGATPTDEQLLRLIRSVYNENPPADGKDGAPGATGATGPTGRGITSLTFKSSGGSCTGVVTYTDGAQDTFPAGDAACPGSTPTTSPTE
jgi:hypothetical protein